MKRTRSPIRKPASPRAWLVPLLALALADAAGAAEGHDKAGDPGDESKAGHSHELSEIHGGTVTMTPDFHFETVFTTTDVRLYAYDGKQNPMPAPKEARASVTLERPRVKARQLDLALVGAKPEEGRGQWYFTVAGDFAAMDSAKAVFRIEGLSKKPVEFRTPVTVVERAVYTCPMHPEVKADDPLRCPQCGMNLERTAGAHAEHGHEAGHTH